MRAWDDLVHARLNLTAASARSWVISLAPILRLLLYFYEGNIDTIKRVFPGIESRGSDLYLLMTPRGLFYRELEISPFKRGKSPILQSTCCDAM